MSEKKPKKQSLFAQSLKSNQICIKNDKGFPEAFSLKNIKEIIQKPNDQDSTRDLEVKQQYLNQGQQQDQSQKYQDQLSKHEDKQHQNQQQKDQYQSQKQQYHPQKQQHQPLEHQDQSPKPHNQPPEHHNQPSRHHNHPLDYPHYPDHPDQPSQQLYHPYNQPYQPQKEPMTKSKMIKPDFYKEIKGQDYKQIFQENMKTIENMSIEQIQYAQEIYQDYKRIFQAEDKDILKHSDRSNIGIGLESSNMDLGIVNKGLKTSNTGLEYSNIGLGSSSKGLEYSNSDLEYSNSGLEYLNSGLESTNKELKSSSSGLKALSSGLEASNSGLESSITTTHDNKQALFESLNEMNTIEKLVKYTFYNNAYEVISLEGEDTYKFISENINLHSIHQLVLIITNESNSYSPSQQIFAMEKLGKILQIYLTSIKNKHSHILTIDKHIILIWDLLDYLAKTYQLISKLISSLSKVFISMSSMDLLYTFYKLECYSYHKFIEDVFRINHQVDWNTLNESTSESYHRSYLLRIIECLRFIILSENHDQHQQLSFLIKSLKLIYLMLLFIDDAKQQHPLPSNSNNNNHHHNEDETQKQLLPQVIQVLNEIFKFLTKKTSKDSNEHDHGSPWCKLVKSLIDIVWLLRYKYNVEIGQGIQGVLIDTNFSFRLIEYCLAKNTNLNPIMKLIKIIANQDLKAQISFIYHHHMISKTQTPNAFQLFWYEKLILETMIYNEDLILWIGQQILELNNQSLSSLSFEMGMIMMMYLILVKRSNTQQVVIHKVYERIMKMMDLDKEKSYLKVLSSFKDLSSLIGTKHDLIQACNIESKNRKLQFYHWQIFVNLIDSFEGLKWISLLLTMITEQREEGLSKDIASRYFICLDHIINLLALMKLNRFAKDHEAEVLWKCTRVIAKVLSGSILSISELFIRPYLSLENQGVSAYTSWITVDRIMLILIINDLLKHDTKRFIKLNAEFINMFFYQRDKSRHDMMGVVLEIDEIIQLKHLLYLPKLQVIVKSLVDSKQIKTVDEEDKKLVELIKSNLTIAIGLLKPFSSSITSKPPFPFSNSSYLTLITFKWIMTLFMNERSLYLNEDINALSTELFSLILPKLELQIFERISLATLKFFMTKLGEIYCFNSYGNQLFGKIIVLFTNRYVHLDVLKYSLLALAFQYEFLFYLRHAWEIISTSFNLIYEVFEFKNIPFKLEDFKYPPLKASFYQDYIMNFKRSLQEAGLTLANNSNFLCEIIKNNST